MENVRKISKKYYLREIVACFLVSCLFFNAPVALAEVVMTSNPVGTIEVGPVTPGPVEGYDFTQAMTASDGSIGNFSNFDIASDLFVYCAQPDGGNALFKVTSGGRTEIFGMFVATGNVYLYNGAGIFIGSSGIVNANQFVASALDVVDWQAFVDDPINNKLKFELGEGVTPSAVTNDGLITAPAGVYLVGPQVLNSGTINSGLVVMAAGEKVYLKHDIDSKVYIETPADLYTPDLDPTSDGYNKVDNTGTISSNAKVLLAAGDIFSGALDVSSLAATANRDITLSGTVTTTGDITLVADRDVHADELNAGGSVDITAASGTTINLHADVTSGTDITLNDNTVADAGITLDAGQDVVLADTKTMTGLGALTVEGDRDVVLGGDVEAGGDLILKADADTVNLELGAEVGGVMLAKGNVGTTAGDIDIYGYSIVLDGDSVDAASNLTLHNNTWAADNLTLKAGNNVGSNADLTAVGNLTIEATGGEITAHNIDMAANDKTLSLKQNNKLDLEQNIEAWDNRINTHLVAESTGDSVTSIAAAKWLDIEATAYENIILSDESGNITTKSLTTETGDIKVTAEDGKVYINGPVEAGRSNVEAFGDVIITATDEGYDGTEDAIFLYGAEEGGKSIVARRDIWLNNNTWAADGYLLDAGQDVRVGWQGAQNPSDPAGGYYAAKTLTGEGALTIEADRHITLGGDVETAGDLVLWADKDDAGEPGGDMTALGNITSTGGSIDIYASDDTIILSGDLVEASGNITLHDNTILNGTEDDADQRIDSLDGKLITDDGVNVDKSTEGNVNFGGYDGIEMGGNVTASGMTDAHTMTFEDNVTANGGGAQRFDAGLGTLDADGSITKTTTGDLYLGGDTAIVLGGDVLGTGGFGAGDTIRFEDDVTADGGTQRFDAGPGTLDADGSITKTTTGDLYLGGDTAIVLGGDVLGTGGFGAGDTIRFEDEVTADGTSSPLDQRFDAGDGILDADDDIDKTTAGSLTLAGDAGIYLGDDVYTEDGDLIFENDVTADGTDPYQAFGAKGSGKKLHAQGTITKTTSGNLMLWGGDDLDYEIDLDGDVTVEDGDLILGFPFSDDDATVAAGKTLSASDDIRVYDNLYGEGDLTVDAGDDVMLFDDVEAAGDLDIYASDDTIYLWGDAYAAGDLSLHANTRFKGWYDQYVEAGGTLTADGYLHKLNASLCLGESDGSLYLHAVGDISLADYVQAATDCEDCPGYGGGVSIISDTGKIFTPDDGDNDTLNVAITGRSVDAALIDDSEEGIGVDLPDGPGKAAIVIQSAAELKLGPGAELQASGTYDNTGIVDDRQGVTFLDEPATIGGVDRDEGDPIDVAIYLASTEGDVDVSSPVSIKSAELIDYVPTLTLAQSNGDYRGEWVCEPGGTMVIDAFDTVTFDAGAVEGTPFQDSLEAGEVGDRLEVVSRITEWLFQAVSNGTLPFAGDAAAMSTLWYGNPDSYVLRGSGQGNPAIAALEDDRAWVLEDPILPPPLYQEAGEGAEEQEFGEGGCPALMNWLAGELGIEEDQIEVTVANAFAYSTDIQPCEMCARLMDAATILEDAEGTGVASLVQVVNEFVATPTPPSEEQMASIATAFADHTDDGTYYAAAGEWIDALVEYVGILTFEMGYSAEESTGYANKYIEPVTDTGNASLVAYVQARLAALGG